MFINIRFKYLTYFFLLYIYLFYINYYYIFSVLIFCIILLNNLIFLNQMLLIKFIFILVLIKLINCDQTNMNYKIDIIFHFFLYLFLLNIYNDNSRYDKSKCTIYQILMMVLIFYILLNLTR